ncbi:MAG: hypothetical protein IIV45_08510 [Lachnospiraceae bacterium]|jgi:hypothetical protein|nr:hypothetical protein [Lachnospiraceae bacterium]
MDREYMRSYYRRFYENPSDLVVTESDEFKEKRDLRYNLEDELTEMMGGTGTIMYKKFDEYISAFSEEMEVMREETYLLGAADREQMLK